MDNLRKHFKEGQSYVPAPGVKRCCGHGLTNIKKLKVLRVSYSSIDVLFEEVYVDHKYDSVSGYHQRKGQTATFYFSNSRQLNSFVEFDRSNHNSYSLTF
jgi:hypothetical protein